MTREKSGNGSAALLTGAVLVGALWAHNEGYLSALDLPDRGAQHGTGSYAKPADGPVTSGFGSRWGEMHGGVDVGAPMGAPIRAVADGTVIEAGPATGFGLWMRVRHPSGVVTVYGHMNTIDQPAGARVAAGEQIATVGSRGQSTGPHLHLEVWPNGQRTDRVDPVPWLADRGVELG